MKNTLIIGFATAAVFAALPAGAQQSDYPYMTVHGAPAPYWPWAPGARGPSAEQWTQEEYHHSGTLGRQGLGASPYHPEGPGNAVSPR